MSFESSGDVQTALDNGVLGKPYVAATPSGLDYNSLGGAPVVPSTGAWILDSKGNLYEGEMEEVEIEEDPGIQVSFTFFKDLDATWTLYLDGQIVSASVGFMGIIDPTGCSVSGLPYTVALGGVDTEEMCDCVGGTWNGDTCEDYTYDYIDIYPDATEFKPLENIYFGTALSGVPMDKNFSYNYIHFDLYPTDHSIREDTVWWEFVLYSQPEYADKINCLFIGGSYDDANQECDCQSIPDEAQKCGCQGKIWDDGECVDPE